MKKCPFCDWENEDDASKCLACGTELPVAQPTNDIAVDGLDNAEENGAYSVVITRVGANKIAVIKVIKEATGLGLADSKSRCESGFVASNLSKADADNLVAQLQSVGAEAKCVAGKVDPSAVDKPSDQTGFAGVDNKKNLIIGIIVGVTIVLTLILLFAR